MVSIWLLGNDKAVSISQVRVYISVTKSKYVSKNPTGFISYQNIIHIIESPSLYYVNSATLLEKLLKNLKWKTYHEIFLSVLGHKTFKMRHPANVTNCAHIVTLFTAFFHYAVTFCWKSIFTSTKLQIFYVFILRCKHLD